MAGNLQKLLDEYMKSVSFDNSVNPAVAASFSEKYLKGFNAKEKANNVVKKMKSDGKDATQKIESEEVKARSAAQAPQLVKEKLDGLNAAIAEAKKAVEKEIQKKKLLEVEKLTKEDITNGGGPANMRSDTASLADAQLVKAERTVESVVEDNAFEQMKNTRNNNNTSHTTNESPQTKAHKIVTESQQQTNKENVKIENKNRNESVDKVNEAPNSSPSPRNLVHQNKPSSVISSNSLPSNDTSINDLKGTVPLNVTHLSDSSSSPALVRSPLLLLLVSMCVLGCTVVC
ncbi:uncharacterized protein TM35_000122880 [Trypanosoma theileri]|uniref:Uncharacterized protein n=1 Tax=Trypanosoma theileri TaxID=67003 RepID=A0A1X0NYG6_9TRYP|nr:uncharacterized protein TM35_000122880 [Trypanosoma theileri]ORC89513.1 hypothetical protein TM35_000122880 [Trypanosoma theileri]